ncbi:MAG: P-loop NTPase [Ignavibacteria bacterium]|nr:P-loop NTPase [Ignavibacteria bacterium]
MIGQLNRILELEKLKASQLVKRNNKVVAFTSGKGGTGKSFLSLNIAFSLSKAGKKILLIDFDPNLSNLNIMMNKRAEKNLSSFILQKELLGDLVTEYSSNLHIIFGESGKVDFPSLSQGIIDNFIMQIQSLEQQYDYVFIDTGSGANDELLHLLSSCETKIIVATPEPTAIMDAYVIVKLLKSRNSSGKIGIVINRASTSSEALNAYGNLNKAVKHFLNVDISYCGTVNFDVGVSKSIIAQEIFLERFTKGETVDAINRCAKEITKFSQVVNIDQSNNNPR